MLHGLVHIEFFFAGNQTWLTFLISSVWKQNIFWHTPKGFIDSSAIAYMAPARPQSDGRE